MNATKTTALERKLDGWYREGERLRFAKEPVFWDTDHPVLKLASRLMDGNRTLAWNVLVHGTDVVKIQSLGLDDERRPSRANSHPAVAENRSSDWFRVSFLDGSEAVLQITDQGYWGSEDADVETTVTVVSGSVPVASTDEIDSQRILPINVSIDDARRAVPCELNCSPGLRLPYTDVVVEWSKRGGGFSCYQTTVTAAPEVVAILSDMFDETLQSARDAAATYEPSGDWWSLPREVRAALIQSGIPDAFFVTALR